MRIESTPPQAAIVLDREGCVVDRKGRESCVGRECCVLGYTPWEGKLARGTVSFTLEKEGFEPARRSYQVRRTRRLQEIISLLVKIPNPPEED